MKDYYMASGMQQWKEGQAYEVTFIVTEDCNLHCSYCYQVHKNNKKRMTFDVAKDIVDYLLNNQDIFNSKAVIWDFIGGEPLLEIRLIDKIVDYIKVESYRKNHKWALNYRINIGTNGTLYDSPQVEKFIKKNSDKLNIGITIDGTKRKHDMHRLYKNGTGSYDDVYHNVKKWLKDFPGSTTKVTFGSQDLKYLKESIIHLWEMGMDIVPANVVFEDVWQENDDQIYEEQLKSLADYVIDNKLWNEVNTTLFDDVIGGPNRTADLKANFCGTGRMLAVDASGDIYPCLRFSDFTLESDKPAITIGNIYEGGIKSDRLRPFLALSAESQSSKECLDCDVAFGCAWCQGCNYDCSIGCTIYDRATYICKMHKARVRANNYYWDKLSREHGIYREFPVKNKKHLYIITADDCVEHCNYQSKEKATSIISNSLLKKALNYCEKNFYKPVVLHSKNSDNEIDIDKLSILSRIDIKKYRNDAVANDLNQLVSINIQDIDKFLLGSGFFENVVLSIRPNDIDLLFSSVRRLLARSYRININVIDEDDKLNLTIYEAELKKIGMLLIEYIMQRNYKEVNVITDILFLESMENCKCGEDTYTLAPNGKLYICPAFYFEDPKNFIGDLDYGVTENDLIRTCQLEKSPVCKRCDAYQCNRCVFLNLICQIKLDNTSSFMQFKNTSSGVR